jgi:rhomboid protease GluP
VSETVTPVASRIFEVRFGPQTPKSWTEQWPNNIDLAGSGRLEVTADSLLLTDARNAAPEKRRRFALADIANVQYAEHESGQIVFLRTARDDREVLVWMASKEEALALLERLPKTVTPEFLEAEAQHRKYRENLRAIAPRVVVTPAIIAANVALFVVMLAMGAGLFTVNSLVHLEFGANYGPLTWHGQPWRLLTSAFIHFGVIHLAFNMLALHNGGGFTEKLYGSARFAAIYLLAALAGSVASGWWDATRLSAGASGAIFGVYGALLAYFARHRRAIPMDLLKQVSMGAASLLVYSLAMGAVLGFVDNSAHIGGLLGGAVSGFLLARPFEPAARAVARPWSVAAVVAGVCLVLAIFAAQVMMR